MENKIYDVLELQKMSAIELTSLAETFDVSIQNNFKQSLIYAILDRQADNAHKPSELHVRDRYASVLIIISFLLVGCATQAPRSASLHRAVGFRQETAQYQARRSASKDPGRMYRNWDRRPHKMTRIPLTNWYIF